MPEQPRNPKNAPGPFYVEKGHCISCRAPEHEARGLVAYDKEDGCYFKKQPETPTEVTDAIRAMFVSCIEAYRYAGHDLSIRRRLAELGHSRLCDHPLEGHPVVHRGHARFSLGDETEATAVATKLLSAFEAVQKNGKCTKPVIGYALRAKFTFTVSPLYAISRSYTVERVETPPLGAPAAAYRDASPMHAWLLIDEDSGFAQIWIHEALVNSGATHIRWFSDDQWRTRAVGNELPY